MCCSAGLVGAESVERLARRVMEILEEQDLLRSDGEVVATFRVNADAVSTRRCSGSRSCTRCPTIRRCSASTAPWWATTRWSTRRSWCAPSCPDVPEFTTPPHQDYPYIQGTHRTVTTWLPLRRCLGSEGALRVLVGSPTATGCCPSDRAPRSRDHRSRSPMMIPGGRLATLSPATCWHFSRRRCTAPRRTRRTRSTLGGLPPPTGVRTRRDAIAQTFGVSRRSRLAGTPRRGVVAV